MLNVATFLQTYLCTVKLLKSKNYRKQHTKSFPFTKIGDAFNGFYQNHLPFPLTNAQKKVIKEIRTDLAKDIQMNRLLQGDVGSGKTIVALRAMLSVIDSGGQAALLAPTEVLAAQHVRTFEKLLSCHTKGI